MISPYILVYEASICKYVKNVSIFILFLLYLS